MKKSNSFCFTKIDRKLLVIRWVLLCWAILTVALVTILGYLEFYHSYGSGQTPTILIENSGLTIEKITDKLDKPSSFEFIDKKDILVTQTDGQLKLIRHYDLKKYPILNVNISNYGLRGISSTKILNTTYVVLFFTGRTLGGSGCIEDKASPYPLVGNQIHKYTWNASGLELQNRTLILDLPSTDPPTYSSGKITFGPDGQLYTVLGSVNHEDREQNITDKKNATSSLSIPPCDLSYGKMSDSGAILRTTLNGLPSKKNPFTEKGFERYYAYGILDSFGLAFDPVTQQLWDTERGRGLISELNLVKPGFNSGWKQISGNSTDICCRSEVFTLSQNINNLSASGSYYAEPKFVWDNHSSVTGLVFLNSSKLGIEYVNDLLAGDMQGNIYHFDLDKSREKIVSKNNSSSNHLFATGFGPISDMKIGPDSALYILTLANTSAFPNVILNQSGSLYRVSTNTIDLPFIESQAISADYLGLVGTLAVIIAIVLVVKYHTIFLRYWRRTIGPILPGLLKTVRHK